MTVKELIEELKEFDENLVVIISTTEEFEQPSPVIEKYNFSTLYWDGNSNLVTLPANQEFVKL